MLLLHWEDQTRGQESKSEAYNDQNHQMMWKGQTQEHWQTPPPDFHQWIGVSRISTYQAVYIEEELVALYSCNSSSMILHNGFILNPIIRW